MSSSRTAPVYIVRAKLEGRQSFETVDLSDRVKSLSFEDNEKSTDRLTLKIRNDDYENFANPIFAQGTVLECLFGYADGEMSPPREATITKVTGGAELSVEAHGGEFRMNRERRSRVFLKKKRSQVVEQIAREYGFTAETIHVEDTENLLDHITQAKETDAVFIRDLARREGYEFYIDHQGLHFHPRDLGQKPRREFVYFTDPGRGDILAPPQVENDLTNKPGAIVAKGIDPKTKRPINATADNDSQKGKPGLASFVDVHAAGQQGPEHRTGQSATVVTTEKTQAAAARSAAGAYKKVQLSAAKLSFPAVGDPRVEAKTLITVLGIGALSGNYYITKVVHALGSDYRMTITAIRDGRSEAPPVNPVKSKAVANATPAEGTIARGFGALERRRSPDHRSGAERTTFHPKGAPAKS